MPEFSKLLEVCAAATAVVDSKEVRRALCMPFDAKLSNRILVLTAMMNFDPAVACDWSHVTCLYVRMYII